MKLRVLHNGRKISTSSLWKLWCGNKIKSETRGSIYYYNRKDWFIDGLGGISKIFLYRTLLAQVRSRRFIALAIATSDVGAAILLRDRTTHSRFVLPLNPNDTDFCGFSKQDRTVKLLREASLITWDETPMAKRFAIEMVDWRLRDIMDNIKKFGEKVIVFGGDFR